LVEHVDKRFNRRFDPVAKVAVHFDEMAGCHLRPLMATTASGFDNGEDQPPEAG